MDGNCQRACDIIINAALRTNTVLEFNANGLRRGKQQYADGLRFPYPHRMFWKMAKSAGICAIVNSDCHSPDQLWDTAMEEACRMIDGTGIRLAENLPG